MANGTMPDQSSHDFTDGLYGWITHTDLMSADPVATKAWCEKVFGWKFRPPFETPTGEYHLFAYSNVGGGGISEGEPPAQRNSTPFVHVADARAAFALALREGAEQVAPPERVMDGVTIAMVRAPGRVVFGLSGP